MSKELIERLRADAESTDDIGLCADAADRIEQLEAERDEWKARAEFSYRQRDELNRLCEFNEKTMSALQADNARLREAMKEIRDDFDCDNDAHRYGATCRCCLAEKTLAATPEQSLARYHNEVVEKCAKGCDAEYRDPHNLPAAIVAKRCADTVRAMKEPE